ncbi:acyltransferase [Rhizobium sp. NFR03]|uniref:acyltransferase family protein n=1 Tax=Rhizobium sp. NFR03 TaxID=1566263 RepID=UPI0008B254DD|nr:acyltransferase [Rhizobium sp. NFR03]SES14558.1 exopolysaccharide production protein ExoZ [Rhizobium sp. NFR03]
MSKMGSYQSIQCLRAIAVLMVALVHLYPQQVAIGAAGVDIFFVISGFIMATIGARETPSTFAVRRVARIVPLYWAVTLFMCALALKPGLFSNFTFDIPRLAMSLFFIPYRDIDGIIWPLVKVGWTLNLEIFFYAVFMLCLLTARPVLAAIGAILVLVVVGLLLDPQQAAPITWTSPLLVEFLFGMLIAILPRVKRLVPGLAITAGGVIWFAIAALSQVTPDNEGWRFVVWGGGAALLVLGCLSLEEAGGWPRILRPLALLGDASYSFYLLHGLVIALVAKLLGHGLVAGIVVLVVSTIVSFLSLHLFERPAARIVRRVLSREPAIRT